MLEKSYGVILAGGKGRRLWPTSREEKPKQFIDFFGIGRTQLQQTFDVLSKVLPQDHIYINTGIEYLEYVKEQLPEIPMDHIMAEPIHRNTAPSVAWAVHRIERLCRDASLIVVPSDQSVLDKDIFEQDIYNAINFVSEHESILTIGVKPTRPETGYGYIQKGGMTYTDNIYKVQAFTEKPDKEFAKMFVESGEWVWNTGMFVSTVPCLKKDLAKYLPPVLDEFDAHHPASSLQEEDAYVHENFSRYPNISLDDGILEKSDNVYILECRFGWADLGTWHSIYEATAQDDNENVIIDSEVFLEDATSNLIKLPKGRLGVIQGLEGYVVAEEGNVLLICKKEDSSATIRKLINEVRIKKGDDYV